MLGLFRRETKAHEAALALHAGLAARAREPVFYTRLQVPDTIDGRFDLFTLHAFLVLQALKGRGADIGDALVNAIFAGFEEALRELGVGDMGASRRLKKMADAFYGRLAAYEAADSEAALAEAVTRNLYRGDAARGAEARSLAHYMFEAKARLAAQDLGQGSLDFGPAPSGK